MSTDTENKLQRRPAPAEQFFTLPCDCRGKRGVKLGHYDIVRCPDCRCEFWALQPRRDGPLKLFPWPGLFFKSAGETPAAR